MVRAGVEAIKDKHVWKHAPRMFWGGMLQITVYSCLFAMHIAIIIVFFNPTYPADDQYAPAFWESAWPVWGIGMLVAAFVFLLSLSVTLPGKHRMKRLLLPVRCQRCPKCFYDLSHRPREIDTCPECGAVAPRRECVRLWCRLLRSRF